MEEQIVKTLIEFYKNKGIDLYAVVDDPLFAGLPMPKKVELLKQFASHIGQGTSRGLSKADISAILKDAAWAGAGTAFVAGTGISTALSYFSGGKIPFKALALGVGAGSALSALASVMESRKRIRDRQEIGSKLDTLVDDPSDANAINLLATRNFQIHPNSTVLPVSSAASKAVAKLKGIPDQIINSVIPPHLHLSTLNANIQARTPYANNVKVEDVNTAFDSAEAKVKATHNFKF